MSAQAHTRDRADAQVLMMYLLSLTSSWTDGVDGRCLSDGSRTAPVPGEVQALEQVNAEAWKAPSRQELLGGLSRLDAPGRCECQGPTPT